MNTDKVFLLSHFSVKTCAVFSWIESCINKHWEIWKDLYRDKISDKYNIINCHSVIDSNKFISWWMRIQNNLGKIQEKTNIYYIQQVKRAWDLSSYQCSLLWFLSTKKKYNHIIHVYITWKYRWYMIYYIWI